MRTIIMDVNHLVGITRPLITTTDVKHHVSITTFIITSRLVNVGLWAIAVKEGRQVQRDLLHLHQDSQG
jgi:hypothetical protein